MKKKNLEHKCKNCMLYDRANGQCKVAILINGEEIHMPVFPEDNCHMEEFGIEVEQVRWYCEDNKVKVEYPVGFFGDETKFS